jgi:hypothetical protein
VVVSLCLQPQLLLHRVASIRSVGQDETDGLDGLSHAHLQMGTTSNGMTSVFMQRERSRYRVVREKWNRKYNGVSRAKGE